MFDSNRVASEVRDVLQTAWGTFEASLRGEVERGLHPILAKVRLHALIQSSACFQQMVRADRSTRFLISYPTAS